jgi:hypothetical protein
MGESQELVRIGPIVISTVAFNALVALFATLIGGLLTYLATALAEHRRWKREKRDRFSAEQREAIALALEWTDPLESAVIWASALAGAALRGNHDQDAVHEQWPQVITDLKARDLPARLRVFLPDTVFQGALGIAREIDRLRFQAVACSQALAAGQRPVPGYEEAFNTIGRLEESLSAFKTELAALYRKSFN